MQIRTFERVSETVGESGLRALNPALPPSYQIQKPAFPGA